MQTKYIIGVFFFCFLSIGKKVCAQYSGFSRKICLEAGWGANYPLKPARDFLHPPNYIGLRSFYIGSQYRLNSLWGVRVTYAYNRFDNSGYSNLGLIHHKVVAEGTLNILALIKDDAVPGRRTFDLRVHSGIGASLGKSIYYGKGYNGTLTTQIGVVPWIKVSDRLNLQIDFVAVVNFGQSYDILGIQTSDRVGAYLLGNIGVSWFLGKR